MRQGLQFPKEQSKKKRKKHKDSILQDRRDGTCYLCVKLHGNHQIYRYREEHHVFGGNPDRNISEEEGFKVYLCPEHHRIGPEAAHRNIEIKRLLQQDAQRAYERTHSRAEFMALLNRNYLEEQIDNM